jgi:hypothetical protein
VPNCLKLKFIQLKGEKVLYINLHLTSLGSPNNLPLGLKLDFSSTGGHLAVMGPS